jgi:predicted O-methyltransferase YrrM
MKLDRLLEIFGDLHYPALTSPEEGEKLYRFVLESEVQDIVELGFAHGTSTCYMAAALDERGEGRITTIDRESARERDPNILTVLERTGLAEYVEPLFAANSYNWELMKLIQRQTRGATTEPCFDFCFLDGAHSWETDGLAFFLVDKLLRPGGWILFDDLHWSYGNSQALSQTEKVKAMPEDERNTPQVMKVLSLLAMQHPGYKNVHVQGNWAWIGKQASDEGEPMSAELVARITEPTAARIA